MINHRYQLGEIIGSGRMSEVFVGYDLTQILSEQMGSEIAIKLMRSEFTDCDAAIFSFETEYIIGSSLHHESLVRFFDFCSQPQQTFLVMERLYGQTFAQARKQLTSLGMRDKVELFKKLLLSLAFLHENNLTHADLKPSNIFITQEDGLKLIDLGLSTGPTRNIVDSAYAFSRYYSSPERQKGGEPSFKDDLYAFGCLAYEILSGQYPFKRQDIDRFYFGESRGLINLNLDEAIIYWIEKSLSFDPDLRPRDACHLLTELAHLF